MIYKSLNIKKLAYLMIALLLSFSGQSQELIDVDFSKIVKKNVNPGVASANLCWLMDSDKNISKSKTTFLKAVEEMGIGSLRFPYGHLADNYLWHTAPFDDTKNGLRPKVASKFQAPAKWTWAVKSNGSFKNAMDFDEYMSLCQDLDIKPLVVVNVFSHKYRNGPSLDELIETAVEWVKYANKMNYHVEYWQIGNEVDHHKDLLTPDEYVECYQKFASAMKSVDPNIKVGPGILQNVSYFKKIISKYPDLIDFTSCHQYMWKYIETCANYDLWKSNNEKYIPNVLKMQKTVANSSKPNLEIVITETGVSPSGKGLGNVNNVFKALWYFDLLMNEISQKNVAYSYFWGTHSPWDGNKDVDKNDVAVLLRVDDNSRKPIAEVVKLVNENILENIVKSKQISGNIRTFSSINKEKSKSNIFLMNKSEVEEKVIINLNNFPLKINLFSKMELKGENPDSRVLNKTIEKDIPLINNKIELKLAPLSITVLSSKSMK